MAEFFFYFGRFHPFFSASIERKLPMTSGKGKWHSHRVEIWHFLINQLLQGNFHTSRHRQKGGVVAVCVRLSHHLVVAFQLSLKSLFPPSLCNNQQQPTIAEMDFYYGRKSTNPPIHRAWHSLSLRRSSSWIGGGALLRPIRPHLSPIHHHQM